MMRGGAGNRLLFPDTPHDLWRLEQHYLGVGYRCVAGVDEAGRGALAGPVVAAAVVLPADAEIPGIADSKRLDAEQRWFLYRLIRAHAPAVGIGVMDAPIVDRVNIRQATHRAMAAALAHLDPPADFALIDGSPVDGMAVEHRCLVKGDRHSYLIAAASIVAKVTRDLLMQDLDALYPGYGFAEHKGYGTSTHCQALRRQGPCPIHRRTFAPVADALRLTLPGLSSF
jgi:ribonuclease HII